MNAMGAEWLPLEADQSGVYNFKHPGRYRHPHLYEVLIIEEPQSTVVFDQEKADIYRSPTFRAVNPDITVGRVYDHQQPELYQFPIDLPRIYRPGNPQAELKPPSAYAKLKGILAII